MSEIGQTESGLYVVPNGEDSAEHEPSNAEIMSAINSLAEGLVVAVRKISALQSQLSKIEDEAKQMSSPENLTKMMEGFMGNPPSGMIG